MKYSKRFIKDLVKYWNYIKYQAKAELKVEVINSYLGWIWLFLEPLCFMLIYTFVAGTVFGSKMPYFPVYVFCGLTIWNFFNKTITASIKEVNKNKEIITKVYVPKFVLLIVTIIVNLFKMLISFGLLLVFMFFYKVPISFNILLSIPILISLVLVTFGIGSICMHFGVFMDDLVNLTNIALKFVFYLSGIFYDIQSKVPAPYNNILLNFNPIAFLITSFRNCLIYQTSINYIILIIWFILGIILSIIGIRTIYKHENTYVKVMRG